jgi:hypothetical protein
VEQIDDPLGVESLEGRGFGHVVIPLPQSGTVPISSLGSLKESLYERIESYSDLLRLEGRLSLMCYVE